jgi:uncharacterized protein (DUF1697 family)
MSERCVALLRGVNVGAANRVSKGALAAAFESVGCRNVVTFIQSGNLVFDPPPGDLAHLSEAITKALHASSAVMSVAVLRRRSAWRRIVRDNPFIAANIPDVELFVTCLAAKPSRAAVEALDPNRSPPDAFVVVGSEIYLRLPNGAARTKLSNAWFDTKLGVVGTSRNWRTALRLQEMLDGQA